MKLFALCAMALAAVLIIVGMKDDRTHDRLRGLR